MLFVSDNCGDDRKKRFVDVTCFNNELAYFIILYKYQVFSLRCEIDDVQGAVV